MPSSKMKGSRINSTMCTIILLFIVCGSSSSMALEVGNCFQGKSKMLDGAYCAASQKWQRDGVCVVERISDQKSKAKCHIPDTREFKFSLVANVKLSLGFNSRDVAISQMWIRGQGPGLFWDKPIPMKRSAIGTNSWTVEISYKDDSNGVVCAMAKHCTLNQRAIEFRISKDKEFTHDMLGPNLYIRLPVSKSMSGYSHFRAPRVEVYPWFDNDKVKADELYLSSFKINGTEIKITLLYPPSFYFNVRKKYPVVVLFGTKQGRRIVPLLQHMFVHEASIDEAFVINVHYTDNAPFCAFSPYSTSVWTCKTDMDCHICQNCLDPARKNKCERQFFIDKALRCMYPVHCDSIGDAVLDFIVDKLLEKVQDKVKNRLKIDFPIDRMSILGFDGAGLLACYAALSRPMYYGNAACLSAPFHWPTPTRIESKPKREIESLIHKIEKKLRFQPALQLLYIKQNYYIDIGERDNFFFPVIDAQQHGKWFVDKIKNVVGIDPKNVLYFPRVPDAGNSYFHHRDGGTELLNRIKMPLLFFLGSNGAPNVKFPTFVGGAVYKERELKTNLSYTKSMEEEIADCPEVLKILEYHVPTGVPLLVYSATLAISILLSILITAVVMCLFEASKKSSERELKEEEDFLKEIASIDDLEDLNDLNDLNDHSDLDDLNDN